MTNLFKRSNPANLAKGKFECPPDAIEALEKLKKESLNTPVLKLPDLSQDVCFHTEASAYGIGTVLLNVTSEGEESIVQYASRSPTEAEKIFNG